MTDSEKLELILAEIRNIKQDMSNVKQDVTWTKLHLENVTDKNISILAENYVNLIEKLNQAIPAVSDTDMYKIKVSYLAEKVDKLEKEIAEIRNCIA